MIPPTYKPKTKFMQLAIAEAKRARDRGDYAIGAVITQLIGNREVVIASAGNRVKTSGSSIKHVELETLKYVSSGYGRYLPDFVCIPRMNLVRCAPVPASGRRSEPWCLAFHRKTLPPTARNMVPSNSNGVPVSFRANSSSKRVVFTFPSSTVF